MKDLFSCQCSTTFCGQRIEIHCTVFRIPKKWEITQKDFSEDIGHSSVLEMKKNGMERTVVCGNSRSPQNKRRKKYDTLHSGIRKPTQSAKQLSTYGAVSNWCDGLAEQMLGQTSLRVNKSISKVNDQLSKHLDPQEVASVVQNQTRTEEAANIWRRDHLQRFKMLDPDEQVRAINESAGFIRPVFVGMYHRIGDDVNNGFWKLTLSCREYTQPRAHQDSVVKVWIQKNQGIGQVLKSRLSVVFTNME